MIIKLAGCIVVNSKHDILLLHRQTTTYDHWEIPGGKIEPGEAAEQAASRELLEELGIVVRIKKKLATTRFSDRDREFEYSFFLADSEEKPRIMEPELFSEHSFVSGRDMVRGSLNLSEAAKNFSDLLKSGQITL